MPKYVSKGGDWVEIVPEKAKELLETVVTAQDTEPVIIDDKTYDLNADGVSDDKDVSIAAQVLNQAKKRGRPKKQQ